MPVNTTFKIDASKKYFRCIDFNFLMHRDRFFDASKKTAIIYLINNRCFSIFPKSGNILQYYRTDLVNLLSSSRLFVAVVSPACEALVKYASAFT